MEEPRRTKGTETLVRGSKFSQTFSRFKGIIRIPMRKATPNATQRPPAKDIRGRASGQTVNHPYSRASVTSKPYMSQPMLGLHRTSVDTEAFQDSHPSDPDSDMSSGSADPSPVRLNSEFPLPRAGKLASNDGSRRHSRTLSMHSLSSPPLEAFGVGQEVSNFKTTEGASQQEHPLPNDAQHFQSSRKELERSGDPMSPAPPTPPPKSGRPQPSTTTDLKMQKPPLSETPHKSLANHLPTPSGLKSFTKVPVPNASKSRIRPASSQRLEEPLPPLPISRGSSAFNRPSATAIPTTHSSNDLTSARGEHTDTASSKRPPTITYSSTPAVPTRTSISSHKQTSSVFEPRSGAVTLAVPPPLMRSASEADSEALQLHHAAQASSSSTETVKKESLSSLNRRISLLAGVRPSPTIRPPPLPILNLPKLPLVVPSTDESATGVNRRRSARAGLGSMPALPLQGTNRGVGGHEEVDDMEEEDEEDMEDEDEDDMEDDDENDGDYQTRPSTSTTASSSTLSEGGLTGRGSYELPPSFQRREQPNVRPVLPPLSIASPLDIRFQGASATSSAFGMVVDNEIPSDKKGKNKQVVSTSSLASGSQFLATERDEGGALSDRQALSVFISPPSISHSGSSWGASSSTATMGHSGYFAGPLTIPEAQPLSHTRSDGSDRTPSAAQRSDPFAAASSPLATPRALSKFEAPVAEARPRPRNPAANGDQQATTNRNSFAFGAASNAGSLLVQRPSMYKRASRSLIDIHEISKKEEVERMVREGEEEQEREQKRRSMRRNRTSIATSSTAERGGLGRTSMLKPDELGSMAEEETLPKREGEAAFATTRPTNLDHGGPSIKGIVVDGLTAENGIVSPLGMGMAGGSRTSIIIESTGVGQSETMKRQQQQQNRMSMAPAYEASNPLPLRKRRSMPTFKETTTPPPYPSFAPHPYGLHASIRILPREDEGKEVLPSYSNAISLRAIMPRKMEFSAPGVQAKDRKWKRVLCVLEGTMLKVYRCPHGQGGVSAIEQWWENKVGASDVALHAAPTTSTSAATGPNRTSTAAAMDGTGTEEEKLKQQYLRNPIHDGLRLDSGSRLVEQPIPPPAAAPPVGHGVYGVMDASGKGQQSQVAFTKSALNLAVQFLKPSSRHMRSNSDSGPPSPVSTSSRSQGVPRGSLNLPRSGTSTPTPNSSSFTISSRSHSPMPSSSSTSTTHGSRSHSPMPSTNSSRLTIPSTTSSNISSRPTTPTTGGSGKSSRFRGSNPKSARSETSRKSDSSDPNPHDLIRCYTMQNAESGLGNDYLKRKNVIRVRLEGEQFLLQAKDVPNVVQWIEALQAATNISLDLDDRPMPRGPIFPRRRRRRRPNVPAITTTGAQAPASVTMETYTPTSATAGQPALRRTQ